MSIQRRVSKKKGFTLIELMVVIVIIGILAAIAIPKLFGMTAKAKASEVGPAAGTWSKLQQAYSIETNQVAGFGLIGYTAPGENNSTENFTYTGTPADSVEAGDASWTAKSKTKLGDCGSQKDWTASIAMDGDKIGTPKASTPTEVACKALTPNFHRIQ